MKPALLLDRDGVINADLGHVHRIADFRFIDGIFDVCRAARDLGFLIIVVTNQAGIGRGLYTEREYRRLTAWMLRQFRQRAIAIARVYHCPFHPRYGKGRYRRESALRKPAPGMILKACKEFDLDLAASVLIGDKQSDIVAGKAAGVGTNILFSPRQRQSRLAGAEQSARSLLDIAAWLRKSRTPP